MTEIKIEKKAPVWPWILLGLVILGLLLYFLVFKDNDAETAAVATDTVQTVAPQTEAERPEAVTAYLEYVSSSNMGENHEFTNGALERLARAIEAKAAQVNYTVQPDLDKVRDAANQITQNASAETHANTISSAANTMAGVLANMQQATFPNLSNEAAQVKQAAAAIKPDVQTLEQKDTIRSFFDSAAQILQNMNRP